MKGVRSLDACFLLLFSQGLFLTDLHVQVLLGSLFPNRQQNEAPTQLNLEKLPSARSRTSDSVSGFSCHSVHKANPPVEHFAHLSLLSFQIAVGSF